MTALGEPASWEHTVIRPKRVTGVNSPFAAVPLLGRRVRAPSRLCDSADVSSDQTPESGRTADVRTVLVSSVIGTTVEWYDFFLYSTAAGLVFDELFFPSDDPYIGTMLAFVTFFVGFVARPLGGVLFGHIGDRIGRKRTLVSTMVLMGLATAAMGLLPTYQQVGMLAPALLVLLQIGRAHV